MNTFQCNINGKLCIKRSVDAIELRKKIRATLLKQCGRYDDKKIDIKQIRNPRDGRCNRVDGRGNAITNQLRHL